MTVAAGSLCVALVRGSVDVSAAEAVPTNLDRGRRWPGEFAREQAETAARHGAQIAEEDREAPREQAAPLSDEERRARAQERRRQRVERMTATAASEAVDPDWAPAMEKRFAERFAAKAPPGFELRSATCKTSICVAEVAPLSRETRPGLAGWHHVFGFKRGYVHLREEEDGSSRIIVLGARDGHRLPGGPRDSRQSTSPGDTNQ